MICVHEIDILERAKNVPVGYLRDVAAAAVKNAKNQYCFAPEDYETIRAKYGKYTPSVADTFVKGQVISGCCDHADQY
jgi:hypothetical protein